MTGPETLKVPQERNFNNLLEQRQISANTLLCVGLDADLSKITVKQASVGETLQQFNLGIIDATHDLVCAYKPNIAFYEEHGKEGLDALKWTIDYIKNQYKDIPVILDAKRTDIGNTNLPYARMAFDLMGADAITVNPYFGGEAIQPFLDRKNKGVVVLCRTSNPGSKDLQNDKIYLKDLSPEAYEYFMNLSGVVGGIENVSNALEICDKAFIRQYQQVAYLAAKEWNKNGNVSLVVGATFPAELIQVRKIVGNMQILVPGLGAQGGKPEDIGLSLDTNKRGIVGNNARGIIFAKTQEGETFAQAARREAVKWRDAINVYR